MNVKSNLMLAAVAAALIPIVIFASGATIYFNNLSEFSFTLPQCFLFLSIFSVAVFLFLFFPLYFLCKYKCFNTVALTIFGLGLCMWVQSFFMFYPIAPDRSFPIAADRCFESVTQMYFIVAWEIFIYSIILCVVYYYRHFFIQNSLKILMIIVVTQCITTLPTATSYDVKLLERIPQFKSQFVDSREDNIIIIVLDSTGTDIFDSFLKAKPEYKKNLQDFEYFTHFLSLIPWTLNAMPTLFSGSDYFDKKGDFGKYNVIISNSASIYAQDIMRMYQDNHALLPKLRESGYIIDYYPYVGLQRYFPREYEFNNLSYDNDMIVKKQFIIPQVIFPSIFTPTLVRITPFALRRIAPTALKRFIWDDMGRYFGKITSIIKGNNISVSKDKLVVKDKLVIDDKDKPFFENITNSSCDSQKRFKFVHLCGTHVFDFQPDDIIIPYETLLFDGLSDYLKHLQSLNCYDNSWIIIMGDHGQHKGVHKYRFNPIFLVKRPHAHHETLQMNENVILMRDIAPTLLGELGIQTEKPFSIWNQTEEQKKERQKLWNEYFVKNAE